MARDDLFTHIHKGLRKGLFDVTVAAGATNWTDRDDIARFMTQWTAMVDLLRSHARHEDEHILRILDSHDPAATERAAEEHRDLEDLLDDLAARVEVAASGADAEHGLAVYRDLARFVAAYLPHLHDEETTVMNRIWATCTDEELAATRAAFMAEIGPEERAFSMELMLPALDTPTREALLQRVAAAAPPS
jgi:hypothetical protein